MAAAKRKDQRKADKNAKRERARRAREKVDRMGDQTTNQPLHQRDDRHVLIAMTLASLVAGLLAIANLDRATHAGSLTSDERMLSTSRHGWPLVYLERDVKEKPQFFFRKRLYGWPIPAVEGEQRRWNFGNLTANIGISVAITLAAFWLISFAVRKYDLWKASLQKDR